MSTEGVLASKTTLIRYDSREFLAMNGPVLKYDRSACGTNSPLTFPLPKLPVVNEFLIEVRHWDRKKKASSVLFRCWLHSAFLVPSSKRSHMSKIDKRTGVGTVRLFKLELDKAVKDKKAKLFPPDFYIELQYQVVPSLKLPAALGKSKKPTPSTLKSPSEHAMSTSNKRAVSNTSAESGNAVVECSESTGKGEVGDDEDDDEASDDDTESNTDDSDEEVFGGLSNWFATPYNRALIGLATNSEGEKSTGGDKRGSITGTGLTTAMGSAFSSIFGAAAAEEEEGTTEV